MDNLPPSYTSTEIAKIASDLYNISGDISSLVSFEDQNALIKTQQGKFVLKIANRHWSLDGLDMQTEFLERAAQQAPDLNLPHVIPTLTGETTSVIDGYPVKMLSYVEGNILGDSPRSKNLYRDLGRYIGRFTQMLDGYSHPASRRSNNLWNLDSILDCKIHLDDVEGDEARAIITYFFNRYETQIFKKLPLLRKSVIHNDANEQNFIIDPNYPEKISSLIDFGDLTTSCLINELAITMAYGLLGEDNFTSSAKEIVMGFNAVFPLTVIELEVLPTLIAMRLVQSIILTSHQSKRFPDNEYIVKSQSPVRVLIKRLYESTHFFETITTGL